MRAPPIPATWGASEGSAGHRDRNCRSNRTPLRVRIRTELFHFGVALWAANFDRPCAVKIHMQVSLGIVAGGESGGSQAAAPVRAGREPPFFASPRACYVRPATAARTAPPRAPSFGFRISPMLQVVQGPARRPRSMGEIPTDPVMRISLLAG